MDPPPDRAFQPALLPPPLARPLLQEEPLTTAMTTVLTIGTRHIMIIKKRSKSHSRMANLINI